MTIDPAVTERLTQAAEARALRVPGAAVYLENASLAGVLAWGLSTGPDQDPVRGILEGARITVDLLAAYLTKGTHGEFEPSLVEGAVEAIGVRVDVALEVRHRIRRAERAEAKGGGA